MANLNHSPTILKIEIPFVNECTVESAEWQSKLNAIIVMQPGFISLEFLFPEINGYKTWMIIQRFSSTQHMVAWQRSSSYKVLIAELKHDVLKDQSTLQVSQTSVSAFEKGITEIFISEIIPGQEEAFRNWLAKIHGIEAKFPGFQGTFVQSPSEFGGKYWLTLLQFSTLSELEKWLKSTERAAILQEVAPLVTSLENHRMISPYAGWFSSINHSRSSPSFIWKQTMLVLLVLFPIVMLELRYLSPLLINLNPSFATFIGNAISVTLITWPFMPIAFYFLKWWLVFPISQSLNRKGYLLVFALYVCEIVLFYYFL